MEKKSKKILLALSLISISVGIICAYFLSSRPAKISVSPTLSKGALKGMAIENFHVDGAIQTLQTTGAIFLINIKKGTIGIEQRIGAKRSLAYIDLPSELKGAAGPNQSGIDYFWEGKEGSRMIISGDSVIRFENIKKLDVDLKFVPEFEKFDDRITKYETGGLLALDGNGGFAVIPPSYASNSKFPKMIKDSKWKLDGKDPIPLLFVGILPPRNFDWEKSFIATVHYSSHIQRYPSDLQIEEYAKFAKVLELHSWVWQNRHSEEPDLSSGQAIPLWDDNSYKPQDGKWIPNDENEFRRVINTAHRMGMKVVPYVSTETSEPGQMTLDKYIQEVKRLKETYSIDGIYADGLFYQHPEYGYFAARNLREIFGEDGWLTLHTTHEDGYWAPFINSYMDSLITSEHSAFNRWTSTSYNISNASASMWPEIPLTGNNGLVFLKNIIDGSLRFNNRVVFLDGYQGQWREWRLYFNDDETKLMKKYYLPKLDELRKNGYNN